MAQGPEINPHYQFYFFQYLLAHQHRLLAEKDAQLEKFRSHFGAQQKLIEQLQENLAEELAKRVELEKQLELNSALLKNEEATRVAIYHYDDAREADKYLKEIRKSAKKFSRVTIHNENRKTKARSNKPKGQSQPKRPQITLGDFIITK
jgi:hypothetical protein